MNQALIQVSSLHPSDLVVEQVFKMQSEWCNQFKEQHSLTQDTSRKFLMCSSTLHELLRYSVTSLMIVGSLLEI